MGRIVRIAGRYAVAEPLASGGAASVYLARQAGSDRLQAIKRLHPHLAQDPETRSMLLDEARLVSHVRHPNVVPLLEVVADEGDVLLVMEYVHGASLAQLMKEARRRDQKIPWNIVSAIMVGVLDGLHAAHEARNDHGEPLHIVHRDVSPQNILVGDDGRARLIDFGVAKAAGRLNTTRDGSIKGKLAYMAPEHLKGVPVTRRVDIYGASVVLWEGLTGRRLFTGESEGELVMRVFEASVDPPSRWFLGSSMTSPNVTYRRLEALDALTLRGLSHDPGERFATAHDLRRALAECVPPASPSDVAAWILELAGPTLAMRAESVTALLGEPERASESADPPPALPLLASPAKAAAVRAPWIAVAIGALALAATGAFALRFAQVRDADAREKTSAAIDTPRAVPLAAESSSVVSAAPTADDTLAVSSDVAPAEPGAHRDAGSALVRLPPRVLSGTPRNKVIPSRNTAGAKSSPDCDPPYTRDPAGIILHKPQCIVD